MLTGGQSIPLHIASLTSNKLHFGMCRRQKMSSQGQRHLVTSLCRSYPGAISPGPEWWKWVLRLGDPLKNRFLELSKVAFSAAWRPKWVCKASWTREWSLFRTLQILILSRWWGRMLLCIAWWPHESLLSRPHPSRILGCVEGIKWVKRIKRLI